MSESETTPFDFPCRFPVKAIGPANRGLEALALEIVARHAPGTEETDVTVRPSRGGKWISVTIRIEAQSKGQLDAIYRDLSAEDLVVWAL